MTARRLLALLVALLLMLIAIVVVAAAAAVVVVVVFSLVLLLMPWWMDTVDGGCVSRCLFFLSTPEHSREEHSTYLAIFPLARQTSHVLQSYYILRSRPSTVTVG